MQVNTATTPTDWNAIADAPGLDEDRFAGDAKLYVQFFRKPVMQPACRSKKGAQYTKRLTTSASWFRVTS